MSTWLWQEVFEQPISAVVSLSLALCYIWSQYTQGDPNTRIDEFSFQFERIWNDGQYYRLISSAFLHGNLLHLALNISTCWSIGTEKIFGSLLHLEISLLFLCLCGLVHLLCAKLAKTSLHIGFIQSEVNGSSIGYSGVVFALSTLVTFSAPNAIHAIPILGITLPTILVPVFNLIVTHILIPNASILGHCSGILVGLVFGLCVSAGVDLSSLLKPLWIFPTLAAYFYIVLGSYRGFSSAFAAIWRRASQFSFRQLQSRPAAATIVNGVILGTNSSRHVSSAEKNDLEAGSNTEVV